MVEPVVESDVVGVVVWLDVRELVMVVVGVVVTVNVGVIVGVLVALVVGELVAVDVPLLVADVVGDEVPVVVGVVVVVMVVVGLVVRVDVMVVVGVVTSQLRNDPSWYASAIMFSVATVASQPELSNRNFPNAQPTVSFAPAGPRYSRTMALTAVAVWVQLLAATSTVLSATALASHVTVLAADGHVARARLSMLACAGQLNLVSTAMKRVLPCTQ